MAPLAFSFEGIKVYLYHNDHLPIHIHAKYNEYESIYELIIDNGKLVDIIQRENEYMPLPPVQDKKVRKFLKKHFKQVVEKWTDVVIYNKQIKLTRISGL